MTKLSLEELKEITVQHMKKELDIMETMLTIDVNNAKEFYKWYINHPYCRGIREIQELGKKSRKESN